MTIGAIEMGVFYETILVRNVLTGSEPVELMVKVDTGATMLVLPGWSQEQLQFPVIRSHSPEVIAAS